MRIQALLLVGVLLVALCAATFNIQNQASATVPGTNTLISATYASSTTAAYRGAGGSVVSANGKFVMFSSDSYNLVPSDTNDKIDTFVRDLTTSTTERVSVSSAGVEGDGNSSGAAISETGRYVLFISQASNLIDGFVTPTTYTQLYLRDRNQNTTVLVSKNSSGDLANGDVSGYGVSSDGRFVLLSTSATNLTSGVTNAKDNLYMLDRDSGTFSVLNLKADGTLPTTNNWYTSAQMSCDGSFVVFQYGTNLTADFSNHVDIYLLDRRVGNKLTNLTYWANSSAVGPSISCKGNYIGFASYYATNIDPNVSVTNTSHAYVYDRINGTYHLIDQSSNGVVGTAKFHTYGTERWIGVSDTGVVAFASDSSALTGVSGAQIYLRDIVNSTTELLSQDSSGAPANNPNLYQPTIDENGRVVAYPSQATNLVTVTDRNNWYDVFTSLTGY